MKILCGISYCQSAQELRTKNYACIHVPMFPVEYDNVIMHILHLFLRISDQLVRKFIQELRTKYNITKNQVYVDKSKCKNIIQIETFIQGLAIDWHFVTNKGNGMMEYRDLSGPEHKQIQTNMKLQELIPWHSTLQEIKTIWKDFKELMDIVTETPRYPPVSFKKNNNKIKVEKQYLNLLLPVYFF